jgi:hypothetical protein
MKAAADLSAAKPITGEMDQQYLAFGSADLSASI